MDRLTALVVIAHARLRLTIVEKYPHLLSGNSEMLTPKLAGLSSALAKLKHAVEVDADKLTARIEGASALSAAAFQKAHQVINATEQGVSEIEDFIKSLEGSNGGPLQDSSTTSEQSQPDRLTTNGVSVR